MVGGCVKSLLPPSAAEYYFERHMIFEISLREISKIMCLSKDNLARSAVKILFTQPQNMGFVKRNCGIMSEKFRNKYRIASHRKPRWDYSADALYFLTIVTQNRECVLGEIVETVETHHDGVVETHHDGVVETHGRASLHPEHDEHDEHAEHPHTELTSTKRNPPKRMPQSISSFMAGFKSAVNTKIDDYIDQHQLKIPKYNRKHHFFQLNYHDHIIRNQLEYLNISHYIINNPQNWNKDKFYTNP